MTQYRFVACAAYQFEVTAPILDYGQTCVGKMNQWPFTFGPDGKEFRTPEGVRNNAKTIYKIQLEAQGYAGRAK